MQVTAKLKYLRIAPRKLRLVADLIRGKDVFKARAKLNFLTKRGANPFLKLLESAVANASNNFKLDEKDLYLAKVLVDEGPKLKRWRPRARGQAFPIQKKTSHLLIVLEEKKGVNSEGVNLKKEKKEQVKTELIQKEIKAGVPAAKTDKPKMKPETDKLKPKQITGLKRVFRRKAF